MGTKLVIIGGVAGGASAAARARRVDENAEIVLFERGEFVSFANCGLPYYIGNTIKDRNDLLVTTPKMLRDRFNIDVRTISEVTSIDRANKQVHVKNQKTGETYTERYDKLILSPGAEPVKPPFPGIDMDTIFTLRNIPDSDRIKDYVDRNKPRSAVVVGGGFIGLEMADNLVHRGVKVTIVEMLDQVMAPLDYEMAAIVHNYIRDKGIDLRLNDGVKSFRKNGARTVVTMSNGAEIECDLVILSIGVKPEIVLADAGYDSKENVVQTLERFGADPIIAPNRRKAKTEKEREWEKPLRIRRNTPEWRHLYNKRSSVERVFSRLKEDLDLKSVKVRGLPNVKTHATFSLMTMLLVAIEASKSQKGELSASIGAFRY